MSKIIATQYISLDGVIEDPVGMEGSGMKLVLGWEMPWNAFGIGRINIARDHLD